MHKINHNRYRHKICKYINVFNIIKKITSSYIKIEKEICLIKMHSYIQSKKHGNILYACIKLIILQGKNGLIGKRTNSK